MFDLGPHQGFILASYGVTIIVLAAIVTQSIARYKSAKRRLELAQADDADGANND